MPARPARGRVAVRECPDLLRLKAAAQVQACSQHPALRAKSLKTGNSGILRQEIEQLARQAASPVVDAALLLRGHSLC